MEEIQRYKHRLVFLHGYMSFIYILLCSFLFKLTNKVSVFILLFLAGLSFLSTFWNVKIHTAMCFTKCEDGEYILFEGKLCKITREQNGTESFFFNRRKKLINKKKVTDLPPIDNISYSKLRKGLIVDNYDLYPLNEFKVPRPNFLTMFKEQCVTPLFCFQIFSSLLLCLDEHVMNSLISTGMIILVEGSFVLSRVSTMKIFRKLEHRSFELKRIIKGNGEKVSNEKISSIFLKPGDKIVVDSTIDVPCDLVILEGSCAVNEAMLSGESVPLFKEEIVGNDQVLCFKNQKRHILFSGTKIEKIHRPMTCIVLRTSFDTEQGMLLNKMLQSEDIKYDPEALKFILLLSLISIVNCILTFFYSKKSGYALFIDLIILFTSTIPFELPMEMGMSIQSAVKNLVSKKIYCLEPFRIALAGKVDVCCFDKTGTLTDSKLEVKAVEYSNDNTVKILSCCQNLITVDGEVKGDPLDIAIFNYVAEKVPFKIHHQFSFTSELKRQCVIAEINETTKRVLFCMKGAPEEVQKYLKKIPSNYDSFKRFASEGFRVISLACKELTLNDLKMNQIDRSIFEKDLEFCGFVLLGSSLKKHSFEMCKILRDAGMKILMITGDNLLTAKSVAKQLEIEGEGVEGKDIDKILDSDRFMKYSIFGRAEPKHKELIIKKYKSLGFHTMMVGDGTNDVGALKAADVGVAMLEEQPVANKITPAPKTLIEKMKAETAAFESIKPGDASIAAPFTVRNDSLYSIIEIIQQGRSSLVTTIQMYKILAINSITNAFFYMFVDILGIKFSDQQMVALGVLSSVGFTAITQPKALDFISKEKPITSIFSLYTLSSIISQSAIQISPLYLIYKTIPTPKPVKSFEPSLMNTVLYVVSCVHTIVTLVCNYIGRPFREDLIENKALGLSLLGILGFIANIFLNIHPDLNDLIKVVDIGKYSKFLIGICISIVCLSVVSERMSFKYLMIKK